MKILLFMTHINVYDIINSVKEMGGPTEYHRVRIARLLKDILEEQMCG